MLSSRFVYGLVGLELHIFVDAGFQSVSRSLNRRPVVSHFKNPLVLFLFPIQCTLAFNFCSLFFLVGLKSVTSCIDCGY